MTVNEGSIASLVKDDINLLFEVKEVGGLLSDTELIQQIRNKCDYYELMITLRSNNENELQNKGQKKND